MNRLGSGIQRTLHANAKKFSVVRAGAHVIHIAAVADFVTILFGLHLVLMIDAVKTAIQIILIFAHATPVMTCVR